ncbi:hypothetical protein [Lysinibacillus fusiformis]|uniref:hypothetical protein n=1 Tax=Lysinibacillus fusiformis TaxID=28031 RepID=UPI003557D633
MNDKFYPIVVEVNKIDRKSYTVMNVTITVYTCGIKRNFYVGRHKCYSQIVDHILKLVKKHFWVIDYFKLISVDKEAQKAFDELQQDSLWNSLPGVKNNKVHFIEDKWNYDDMTTSKMLLKEFPNMLAK